MILKKRIFDLAIIILGLIFIIPVIICTGFLVRLKIGSPVLFVQKRTGYKGRPFRIFKFRSMTNSTDGEGKLLPDQDRLLSFGKTLRAASLDELPEIFNVLKGEMSLVGPRPLLVEYLNLYTPEQFKRFDVNPGITGWAQINGRNRLTWEEKFELDVWYVENWSILLDLKIIFSTFLSVLNQDGINQPGTTTADKFKGMN